MIPKRLDASGQEAGPGTGLIRNRSPAPVKLYEMACFAGSPINTAEALDADAPAIEFEDRESVPFIEVEICWRPPGVVRPSGSTHTTHDQS